MIEHQKEHEPKGGVKHDQDKVRYDLITMEMLDALAERLTLGAAKYSDRNWELGINYNRLYRGALGHLAKWFYGEDTDPEDGGSHLDAAFACIGFLVTEVRRAHLAAIHDNRPNRSLRPISRPFEGQEPIEYVIMKAPGVNIKNPPVEMVETEPVSDESTGEEVPDQISGRRIHKATPDMWGRCGAGLRFGPILDTEDDTKVTCKTCKRFMAAD